MFGGSWIGDGCEAARVEDEHLVPSAQDGVSTVEAREVEPAALLDGGDIPGGCRQSAKLDAQRSRSWRRWQ